MDMAGSPSGLIERGPPHLKQTNMLLKEVYLMMGVFVNSLLIPGAAVVFTVSFGKHNGCTRRLPIKEK
jgi:hypothetical protein